MTEALINIALFLGAVLAATYTQRVRRLAGKHAGAAQQAAFALLVLNLYLFSLNETIRESGVLYGVSFSMIPLITGATVLAVFRKARR